VCHPSTPKPNALPFSADLTAFSKPFLYLDLCINSSNTPSKNLKESEKKFETDVE